MFDKIVVGAAQTEAAQLAIAQAITLAETFDAELHLVLAYDAFPDRAHPETRPASTDAETFLEGLASGYPNTVVRHAVPGDPADAILGVADEVGADLIVVGNKGMKGKGRVLGSVTNTISHKAGCSVLIVSTT
jgi:nucleotide-binding universal stress UspA family protein